MTIGIVGRFSSPFSIRSPSTAEETETGGVIIPSASKAEAPMIVGIIRFLPFFLINEYKEKIHKYIKPLMKRIKEYQTKGAK